MGLDQYAYVAAKASQRDEFYESSAWDESAKDFVNTTVTKPHEIAYWRKHPNLHGWMERLWHKKLDLGYDPNAEFRDDEDPGDFNGVELELTSQDLDELEQAITHGQLPETKGFFFGDPKDEYYRAQDLDFISEARFYMLSGAKVFYNSSW